MSSVVPVQGKGPCASFWYRIMATATSRWETCYEVWWMGKASRMTMSRTMSNRVMLLNILKRAVMPETLESILIDGFPRRLDQGIASEDQFGKPGRVLFFDCNESVARGRYLTRLNQAVLKYYQGLGVLITIDTNAERKISYERLVAALKHDGEQEHYKTTL